MSPSQLFPDSIPSRDTNTKNSVIRGIGVTSKDTNLLLGSVSISVISSNDLDEAGQVILLCNCFQGKKDEAQPIISFWRCIWSWLIWVSVKILMSLLLFLFCKTQVPDLVLRDIWWHQHCNISCSNHWKIKEKKVP